MPEELEKEEPQDEEPVEPEEDLEPQEPIEPEVEEEKIDYKTKFEETENKFNQLNEKVEKLFNEKQSQIQPQQPQPQQNDFFKRLVEEEVREKIDEYALMGYDTASINDRTMRDLYAKAERKVDKELRRDLYFDNKIKEKEEELNKLKTEVKNQDPQRNALKEVVRKHENFYKQYGDEEKQLLVARGIEDFKRAGTRRPPSQNKEDSGYMPSGGGVKRSNPATKQNEMEKQTDKKFGFTEEDNKLLKS